LKPDYRKIFIIVLVSFALGFIYNFLSQNGISIIRQETEIIYDETINYDGNKDDIKINEIRALNTAQVYEIFTNKEAVFVDARDSWDFSDGHIPGAVNIPEYKFTPDDPNIKYLDKNRKIIVYCEGDQCEVSQRLAVELQKLGYKKVWIYFGGWKEWFENNLPAEKL